MRFLIVLIIKFKQYNFSRKFTITKLCYIFYSHAFAITIDFQIIKYFAIVFMRIWIFIFKFLAFWSLSLSTFYFLFSTCNTQKRIGIAANIYLGQVFLTAEITVKLLTYKLELFQYVLNENQDISLKTHSVLLYSSLRIIVS